MKRSLTVIVAVSLLAGAVATANADDHGRSNGPRHQQQSHGQYHNQSHNQSHDWSGNRPDSRSGDFRSHDNRSAWSNGRHDGRTSNNGSRDNGSWRNDGRRHDFNGSRGFDNVHFGPHRFVERRGPRDFFPGNRFHNPGFNDYGRRVRYRVDPYRQPRGYYNGYAWHRGERLPVAFYAPRYVVRDYGAYRLAPPPWGYQWVRVDNDVVLAAITTGLVLSVVDNLFW
jgi:Ni/Co efflux regulator RcnB